MMPVRTGIMPILSSCESRFRQCDIKNSCIFVVLYYINARKMTDQEREDFIRFMDEYVRNMDTEEKKTRFLQKVGVLDENGELTELYQHLPLCFPPQTPTKEAM
jgi:hypothetical protein